MSEPHWVWATDANTRQRVPVNLTATPFMLPVKKQDGSMVTAMFFGGMTIDANGAIHYAQAQVLETPQELFSSPKIKLRSKDKKLPPEIAKLAAPHKTGKAA